MKTFNQFKQEQGVTTIDFVQKNGRAFAGVGNQQLVVSKGCDPKKPLFVIPLTKKDSDEVIANTHLLINSEIKVAFSA